MKYSDIITVRISATIDNVELIDPSEPDDKIINAIKTNLTGANMVFSFRHPLEKLVKMNRLTIPKPQERVFDHTTGEEIPRFTEVKAKVEPDEKRYGGPASSWGSTPDKCPDWKPCGMCGGNGRGDYIKECLDCLGTGCDYFRAGDCANSEHGANRCDRRGR